ncbi:MAG: carotenoid biosynthesis protein [Ferruginibacter sp.]
MIKLAKYQVATAIALFFHSIGLLGLLFFDNGFFIRSTPFNLLLSFSLLVWTQQGKNIAFFVFMVAVLLIGIFSEMAGVNTGLLFGDYSYGKVLGVQWMGVPLIIGVNWFIIIYCCGISTQTLLLKVIRRVAIDSKEPPLLIKAMSVIIDSATMAVAFDWLMEPVAIKLGFWTWQGNGEVPFFNYISWLVISMLMLTIFQFCRFNKKNKFAVNLFLIQVMFFLLLRTFLK